MNLVLLFPGQGAQYTGMGKSFCDRYASAKVTFEEANDVLGYDLQNLCFYGKIEELTQTEYAQPGLLTVSMAIFRVFMEEIGIKPIYALGHSLGEISAITCAGGLQFRDALKIVQKRGRLMQETLPDGAGTMSSISGIDKSVIEEECHRLCSEDEIVVVSNYNSPQQTIISGHRHAVAKVGQKLVANGAIVTNLNVSSAFHSPLMKPMVPDFSAELAKYSFQDLNWPVISNVDAVPYFKSSEICNRLIRQIEEPVRWQESIHYIQKQGITHAIEIGPKTVLKNLMIRNAPEIVTYSYDKSEDRLSLVKGPLRKSTQAGSAEEDIQTVVTMCLAAAVSTRNRNWNEEEFLKGVIEPYQRIRAMQSVLKKQGNKPSLSQMQEALDMLRSVLVTKKVPLNEQKERFNQIVETTGTNHLFRDLAG
ncbi:MAG TPA: [acyl-carrier-protein] S-malonyltransferase [Firmicutes bacterium]|jgi:[acyl-carrier-protein] S-malonyltransferase|nr:[acyl-carrier-protein] S-malonyltransferase [Bacillota bacterium]